MKKGVLLPLILLGALILAIGFRYNVEATKTGSSTVTKWERDRSPVGEGLW